jgi:hypothetical protein
MQEKAGSAQATRVDGTIQDTQWRIVDQARLEVQLRAAESDACSATPSGGFGYESCPPGEESARLADNTLAACSTLIDRGKGAGQPDKKIMSKDTPGTKSAVVGKETMRSWERTICVAG